MCVAASKEQIGGILIELMHLYNTYILVEIERLQDLIGFYATFIFLWNFYSLEIISDWNRFVLKINNNVHEIRIVFRF